MIKRIVLCAAALYLASGAAANAEVNFGISVGQPAYVAPAPYIAPAPAYVAPYPTYVAPYPNYYDPHHRWHDYNYWRGRHEWHRR